MTVIHKFTLTHDNQSFALPANAQVLSAGIPKELIVIWVLLDERAPKIKRWFRFFGTGEQIAQSPEALCFVQTVFYKDLVWHVFEVFR